MLLRFVVPAMFLLFLQVNNACAGSIRNSSIKWDEAEKRMKLLASVPGWDEAAMKLMFNVYRDAEHNQLPKTDNERQYNVEFINAMWGPLSNPFAKYPRPAKAFVSFNHSADFYMVPLIKDVSDGNYYIFDKRQTRPVLLGDWITNIMATHGAADMRFNICNGYGGALDDVCMKEYQSEIDDTLGRSHRNSRNLLANHHSARRDINEDWTTKINSTRLAKRSFTTSDNILESSIDWKNGNSKTRLLNTVTSWPNLKIIQANFEKIRDIRYFNDTEVKGFMRRISWLFPDDGCWTRATAMIKDLFGPMHNAANQYPRPSKIFAFGNLCVNTDNSKQGYVSWWYHTAPVVRDAQTGVVYVLDPAVNARKPLSVEQWTAAISANSGACRQRLNKVSQFNICNGYGTMPDSRCDSNYSEEESQDTAQPYYQQSERRRQAMMGRNTNAILGDSPPWLTM